MATRKNMTFPIIIALIFIVIIIYLFATIKQTEVSCVKTRTYDGEVRLTEDLVAIMDGKEIKGMHLEKAIVLPDKFSDDKHLKAIRNALDNTLEYLGNKVKYTVGDNKIVVKIDVDNNQLILLNNIDFNANEDLIIKINSNTKSSDVITLAVGDNYTEGELMKRLKNNGYSCQ